MTYGRVKEMKGFVDIFYDKAIKEKVFMFFFTYSKIIKTATRRNYLLQ